jgi:uncharacterized membrane protein
MHRARPWAIPLLLLLTGCVGVAISVYLTAVHYAHVPLVCTSNGVINCERVLSSSYSSVAGVPVSAGGAVWFAVVGLMGGLALRRGPEPAWLQPAQVVWSFAGLLTVFYLVGVEVLALGVLCVWCTSLHVLIVVTVLLSILRTPLRENDPALTGTVAAPTRPSSSPR